MASEPAGALLVGRVDRASAVGEDERRQSVILPPSCRFPESIGSFALLLAQAPASSRELLLADDALDLRARLGLEPVGAPAFPSSARPIAAQLDFARLDLEA